MLYSNHISWPSHFWRCGLKSYTVQNDWQCQIWLLANEIQQKINSWQHLSTHLVDICLIGFQWEWRVPRMNYSGPFFENFGDIKNVLSISDDAIVYGFEDGSNHDQALNELFQKAKERNCNFNPGNLMVHTSEIPFFGHISKDCVKPDPQKGGSDCPDATL